jgi:C1A family cysteine protease
VKYVRLDPAGASRDEVLWTVKASLAAGVPPMFGFTVYDSITQAGTTGRIPFPRKGERVLGGHAVAAVGYDDAMRIRNAAPGSPETVGALLIRNSWGPAWGEAGYGWLPYEYVNSGLAVDWWTLLKQEWVDTGVFG